MSKKMIGIVVVALLIFIGLTQFVARRPIYIGFSAGLSGQWSQLGVQVRNGFLLAIEDVNAAGGIKGRKIIPVIIDNQNDNDYTPSLIDQLQEKGVDYFVGFSISSMTPSINKILHETDILIMSPTMSTNTLTGIDDNFFRVCNASIEETNIIIDSLNQSSSKDFILLYDTSNKPYTEPMRNTLIEKTKDSDIELVFEKAFNSQTVAYDLLIDEIAQMSASNIVIFASGVDTADIAQRLRLAGNTAQLYSAAWATTDELLHSGGQAIEGMRVSGLYDISSTNPQYLEFKQKMIETYNDAPSFPEIYGYESIMIIKEAIILADSYDPYKVKEAIIQQGTFQGLQQPIEYDDFGDAHRPYYLYKVKNGEFVSTEK
jgi:branched-chain amino acid transport system substrate-binding protein